MTQILPLVGLCNPILLAVWKDILLETQDKALVLNIVGNIVGEIPWWLCLLEPSMLQHSLKLCQDNLQKYDEWGNCNPKVSREWWWFQPRQVGWKFREWSERGFSSCSQLLDKGRIFNLTKVSSVWWTKTHLDTSKSETNPETSQSMQGRNSK